MSLKHAMNLLLLIALASAVGLGDIASALEVGEKAPDFTLESTEGKKFSLNQFQGKKLVLVEFYVEDLGAT
jgi:thioredoxin-dependent peroxiredoxin